MPKQEQGLRSCIDRLEKVERQNRWCKAGLSFSLLALCALVFMGAAGSGGDETIRAEKFQLVTPDGRLLAELGVGPDGLAGLVFFDEAEQVASAYGRGGFFVADIERKRFVRIGANPETGGSGIGVMDENETMRIGIGRGADGGYGIGIFDETGNARVGMGSNPYGFAVVDENGETIFAEP